MPGPFVFDHLFVAYLAVVFPLIAWRSFPTLAARIRDGGEPALLRAYRSTIVTWAVHLLLLLALWLLAGRDWPALGFRTAAPGDTFYGVLMTAALLGFFTWQGRRQLAGRVGRVELEAAIGRVAVMLPRSAREERWFRVVSVNAGITEEILFRGYLYWYLSHWFEPLVAAAGTVVAFTAGHLYQGLRQLPGIALMGTFSILLYLVSDSIILPIVAHALVDMIQGRTIAGMLRRGEVASGQGTGT